MSLTQKISVARQKIESAMTVAKNAAAMVSFGKDSMVMLHIMREFGVKVPVIFHREPMLPKKYRFAQRVIEDWDLTVYDYPPTGTAVQMEGDCVEVVNFYPAGLKPMILPTGICAPTEGEPTLCALHDFYLKPLGTGFAYPWDLVFVGHKSTDIDPIYGAIPLKSDFHQNIGSASVAFPIGHFTDEEVWAYHEQYDVPIHHERYEKTASGWRERSDKSLNPDYFPACSACMKPNGGAVPCPRLNGNIVSNISTQLQWLPRQKLSYLDAQPAAAQ